MCGNCDRDEELMDGIDQVCRCNCRFEEYSIADIMSGPFRYRCKKCEHDEVAQ